MRRSVVVGLIISMVQLGLVGGCGLFLKELAAILCWFLLTPGWIVATLLPAHDGTIPGYEAFQVAVVFLTNFVFWTFFVGGVRQVWMRINRFKSR